MREQNGRPLLPLLEEPMEGLAHVVVERLVATMRELKAAGLPIFLVEQRLDVCRAVAERQVIVDEGRVVGRGDTEALDSAD